MKRLIPLLSTLALLGIRCETVIEAPDNYWGDLYSYSHKIPFTASLYIQGETLYGFGKIAFVDKFQETSAQVFGTFHNDTINIRITPSLKNWEFHYRSIGKYSEYQYRGVFSGKYSSSPTLIIHSTDYIMERTP